MKMKKFLASVLAALMAVSSMSFIASAQETETEATLAETVEITFNRRNGSSSKITSDKSMYATTTASFEVGQTVTFPASGEYIYHTFKGWSTEIDGEVIEDLSTVTATVPTTYYGVWEWSKPDDGTPLESITRAKNEGIANENAADGGTWYDAVAGVVYKTIKPKTVGNTGSANMHSGLKYAIPGTELHMVALVRTNMIDATTSTAGIYQTSNKDGAIPSWSGLAASSPVKKADEWTVLHLKSTGLKEFGVGIHIDFYVVGNDPANDLENDYYDVAGMALFGTEEEAKAWDIYAQNAYTGTAVISFDAQITEDDDTDVYTEYPENLENDGNALVGWTLDPTAEVIEYVDLTKLPVPTEDATYYAVWNEERTINFYKNDGTDEVETLVLGKGATVTVPTFISEGKMFLGWALDAEGTELVEVPATAEDSVDYYAIWKDFWFTKLTVNDDNFDGARTNGRPYGINNLQFAEEFNIVMPYGYPTDVIPTLTVEGNKGTITYTAPESFDGEGKITVAYDDKTVDYPVTFTVADKSTVTDLTGVPTSGIDSSGRGLYGEKNNTDKGIEATKFIPIYTEQSEYYEKVEDKDGKVTGKFLPEQYVGIEGWRLMKDGGFNAESYDQFRILAYYDDGGDGIDLAKPDPYITYSGYGSRGTVKGTKLYPENQFKTNRWEYIYYDLDDTKYGWTTQPHFHIFGYSQAKNLKNDVFYVAKIDLLVDGDEKFLQYAPVGLASTNETSAKNDGTITGVTADMEIAIGDGEFAPLTEYSYDADAKTVFGLAPATYYVRYAGDDVYAASEAVEIVITPDSVEIYFEDGDPATNVVEQKYEYNEAITAPEAPVKTGYEFKGWALEDAEEAYDFEGATATEELDGATFNAIWERLTTVYVNGAATENGDGFTAPVNSLEAAWNLVADTDATIVITGETKLTGKITGKGGNVTVTAEDDGFLTWSKGSTATFSRGDDGGTIKFENITIKYFDANSDNGYQFMNFKGLGYEFGEGVTVPTGEIDGVKYYNLKVRSGGEDGDNYKVGEERFVPVADKVIIRDGNFRAIHLGGKGKATIEDIDVEFYGGATSLNVGNDIAGDNKGILTNAKILLEAKPTSVSMQNVSAMTGAYQFIANNGVDTVPAVTVEPADGKWVIHSAEGGRADFTETIGTYKFTTDKTYIVITDAEGNSTKYRAADGVTGDAELYAAESILELALKAGTYTVSYTDEGVSVSGEFMDASMTQYFDLNADNNYTVEAGSTVIANANENAPKGYKFSGEFATRDGKYMTENGVFTVTEYTADYIVLYPVYVEDDSVAYYHTTALYNDKLGTVDVTVAIANGKFTAGTVGGTFDKDALEFAGYTLADGISNNLGDAPAIVKDAMYDGEDNKFVLVWDAMEGNIDATAGDVEIVTFHFDVVDGIVVDAENIDDYVGFYHPENIYEGYFADGYYKASPVLAEGEDEFAVNYVDVFEGKIGFEVVPSDPATITVKVTMPDKAGATTDDIAYLAYAKESSQLDWNFIALEEAGNEEETIEKVISDVFFVGETYVFKLLKNGYTGSEVKTITIEDGMTLESVFIGGDIKESFTGEDENAVDIYDFGDGDVTLADFVRVVRAFDEEATDEYKAVVDINEDGVVNVTDLSIVKENFGKSYEEVVIEILTNI